MSAPIKFTATTHTASVPTVGSAEEGYPNLLAGKDAAMRWLDDLREAVIAVCDEVPPDQDEATIKVDTASGTVTAEWRTDV